MKEYRIENYETLDKSFFVNIGKDTASEKHVHNYIEIVFVVKGSAVHVIDNVECFARRGTVLYINCGQTHSYKSNGDYEYYNLMLTHEFLNSIFADNENMSGVIFEQIQKMGFGVCPFIELRGDVLHEMDVLFSALRREVMNKQSGSCRKILIHSYLTAILINIFRHIDDNDKKMVAKELLDYVNEHCDECITLRSIARQYFYNPSYLSRMFKKYHGVTFTEYLTEARLKKAMYLIENTVKSIDEIIPACGFADRTTFYKKFRQYTGLSPSEYRKAR